MTISDDLSTTFHRDGRIWLRRALSEKCLSALDAFADPGQQPGARLPIDGALAELLAAHGEISRHLIPVMSFPRAVRAVSFNKSDTNNWGVPWHQDRVIVVRDRAAVAGFGNWSLKAGAWHCEPPEIVLSGMLFVRLNLDGCDAENGAMEIALGSHHAGIVAADCAADCAADIAARHDTETCDAERGDILIMNMLLLHRSGPSLGGAGRRALRVDFAGGDLPAPLSWA